MAMTIVNNILKQMPAVGQPQRKFIVMLFSTILALRGRVNVRHLSLDGDDAERAIARQFRRSFDWPDVHQRVLTTALDPQAEVISAPDASCMPKSGQQTFGLGHCFNSGAGRAERGREISTLAVVDVTHRCACTLAVAPTPPTCATATTQDQEATRVDCSTQPRRVQHHRLPASVTSHAVDGDVAKKQSIAAVVDRRRHPSTKLRGEAHGRFLCTGSPPTRRGAHRKSDGKVHWQYVRRCEALGTLAEAEQVHL
jgi:DDE superfamily endonuclease